MKKMWLVFLIVFTAINISLIIINIFPSKVYVKEVNNDIISFNMLEGYFLREDYENDTSTFQLYSDDKKSSVNIIVLEQLISNQNLYTTEQMSKSINYQVLKNIKDYEEKKFFIENNISYSKNYNDDNIMEILIRYEDLKILVISYISPKNLYDDTLIKKLNENIIIK